MTRVRSAGFTLLEVMIALAILAGALTVLISISATSAKASMRASRLTVAVGLARGKMYDLEEELLHEGFQDTAETLEGKFDDEGYPDIEWSALIEKIELPTGADLQNALGAQEGAEPAEGEEGTAGGMGGLAGMLGGGGGATMAGMGVLTSQFDMIKTVMEGALRKVTLTVRWKVGKDEESFEVVCYFTDPKAVDEAVGAAAGGGTGQEGETPAPRGPGGEPTAPGGGGRR